MCLFFWRSWQRAVYVFGDGWSWSGGVWVRLVDWMLSCRWLKNDEKIDRHEQRHMVREGKSKKPWRSIWVQIGCNWIVGVITTIYFIINKEPNCLEHKQHAPLQCLHIFESNLSVLNDLKGGKVACPWMFYRDPIE